VLNRAEVGEEQNDPNRIDDAIIFELEVVRGVSGDLKTAGDSRNGYREKLRKDMGQFGVIDQTKQPNPVYCQEHASFF